MPCWSAYELVVDDVPVVIDISDYILVDPAVGGFRHWLRFTYTPLFVPFPNIGSFPITSFLGWEEYERLRRELTYRAAGDCVVYGQSDAAAENPPYQKTKRRQRVRRILRERYQGTLDDAWTDRTTYWRRAAQSLVTVCAPGSDNHHLDRGQHQLLGLGVCTISPDIFMAPLGDRLVPGEHYVACRDDYADLLEQIEWCREHRAQCLAIGRRASAFFEAHSTPPSIWEYIKARIGG